MDRRKLLRYLPPFMQTYQELGWIMGAQQAETDALWDALDAALQDEFVLTAAEYGISRWEAILHIRPKATDTLEERRLRVLNLLVLRLPYTITFLRQRMDALFGPGNYGLEMDHRNYTLRVDVIVTEHSQFAITEAFRDLLAIIKPCNIVYNASVTTPEIEKSLYITPCLGRSMSITHLPELAWPESTTKEASA